MGWGVIRGRPWPAAVCGRARGFRGVIGRRGPALDWCGGADPELGLHRDVRLRTFVVSEPVVNPLLDIDTLDDPRWGWHAAVVLGAEVPRVQQYLRAGPKLWAPAAERAKA